MNYIDLFSGAGGLGLGFEEQGFNNIFSVEFNKDIAKTYQYNFPNNHLIIDDIKNLTTSQLLHMKLRLRYFLKNRCT